MNGCMGNDDMNGCMGNDDMHGCIAGEELYYVESAKEHTHSSIYLY